jgi:steroid delta-isomerase-like uncharacterized protein
MPHRTEEPYAVKAFFLAYGKHDVGMMLAACTNDANVRFVPLGKAGEGKVRRLGKNFWSTLFDAFSNVTITVQRAFAGKHAASAEVVIAGTQRKEFLQIPNHGKHFSLPHAFEFELEDEKISGMTIYWDNVTLFSELGKEHPFDSEWNQRVMTDILQDDA